MILFTGTVDVDPAQRDAFVEAAQALMAATRMEAGCEQYVLSADLDDPNRFHLSERWASAGAVEAHTTAPHLASFMAAIGAVVRASSVTRWDGATASTIR